MAVMIISFEASANVDTTLFGYFSMEYDPELFNDIKENLTEISKEEPISFSLDTDEVKLLQGSYHNIKRVISVSDVEQNKFTDVLKRKFDSSTFKDSNNASYTLIMITFILLDFMTKKQIQSNSSP